jgi:phage terminase Nu1 subunit (DNA packaging protein)
MNTADYAKHRGVSRQAVQQAIREGRLGAAITRGPKGQYSIDAGLADVEWDRNTDPTRKPKGGETATDYQLAKARREAALASMAEDELRRRRGELVSAANLGNRLRDVFTQCKTKLLGIPTRARQALPHLTGADVGVLDSLVREALEDLAEGRFEVRS